MRTHILSLPSAQLHYRDTGRGDTALVFLHGAFIHQGYWEAQREHFRADYRVVAVDLAGHGASVNRLSERHVNDYATEVRALLDTLALKRVVLVGHSFGSDIALETIAADASGVIGFVEIDHFKNLGQEPPAALIEQVVAGLKLDFAGTAAAFARQALLTAATPPALVDRLLRDYARTDPAVGIQLFEQLPGYAQREAALLSELPVALHAIHVDYTPTNEGALAKATRENYELRVMAGTCHYPMVERAAAFNEALAGALQEILIQQPREAG